jgi:hypothetical protein
LSALGSLASIADAALPPLMASASGVHWLFGAAELTELISILPECRAIFERLAMAREPMIDRPLIAIVDA